MADAVITTYLQDHHAGSVAGVRAFEHVASEHADAEVREAVGRIAEEVRQDQDGLERIMETFGVSPSLVKEGPAYVAERLARLKPNDRIGERSPLTDVEELEQLVLAVYGKSLGWRLLLQLDDERLDRAELEELHRRAIEQRDELERLRLVQAEKLLRA